MKNVLHFLMMTGLLMFGLHSQAQTGQQPRPPACIMPLRVEVSTNKTTNILFHYRIKRVDLGSTDITAEQANDTALLVKAAIDSFAETNLSVYTGDGALYSFLVNWSESPSCLNLLVNGYAGQQPQPQESWAPLSDKALETDAGEALTKHFIFRHPHAKTFGVSIRLKSIFIDRNAVFFVLDLANLTQLTYDINSCRFFIKDAKKAKRLATQDNEILPLYMAGNGQSIPALSHHLVVYALPKFTIPDKKYFTVALQEQNGSRNLNLVLHNKTIVKAKQLREQNNK